MIKNLKRETIGILSCLVPLSYLAFVWHKLPDVVPVHFDVHGVADDWSTKSNVAIFMGLFFVGLFIVKLILPKIDPKRRFNEMQRSYNIIMDGIMIFMSLIALFIIQSMLKGAMLNTILLDCLVGGLFICLGNYLPTVKPNYFVGIRTPWTLNNETVWRKTHKIGGRLMMLGGVMIIFFSLLGNVAFKGSVILFASLGIAIFTYIYSYLENRKLINGQ